MKDLGITLVREFHETFNCHIGEKPEVPVISDSTQDMMLSYQLRASSLAHELKQMAGRKAKDDPKGALLLIRLQLIQEELSELAEAFLNRDPVEAFDALVDLSYVVDGTYITLGLSDYKVAGIKEVHRSNMSKLDENGKPLVSEAGRVIKSDQYSPPDLLAVLSGDPS